MAEYLIQDTSLDAIADAINAKTGGSSAMTPAQMVLEIQSIPTGGGGDPYAIARSILDRSITEYIDDGLTAIGHSAFRDCKRLTTLRAHGVTAVGTACIEGTKISALAFPSLTTIASPAYGNLSTLLVLDYGESFGSIGSNALPFINLQTLILRRSSSLVNGATSSMNGTPMKQGGAGCTIYIPKALYDHLGDGTALDYKNATIWSTYDAYGTITWAQIEGSQYENYYGDGTPIRPL